MENKIILRKGKLSDIPKLIDLFQGAKELEDYAGQKYEKKYFKEYINNNNAGILVALRGKELLGAINFEFSNIAKHTFLINIIVSKNERGKGIGRILMKKVEEIARKKNHEHLFALVYIWNENMQKIMEHYSYIPTSKAIYYSKKL